MMGKTHQLVAVNAAYAGCVVTHVPLFTGVTVVAIAAATSHGWLSPDVDQKVGIEHRTVTHYLSTAMLTAITVAIGVGVAFGPEWGLLLLAGVGIGWVSHILADGCTLSGVPLYGPVIKRDIHLLPRGMRIRTDGPVEHVLMAAGVLADVAYIATTYGGI